MKYRRFGRTNWQVGEIGYGMWGMAGWTGSDDEESLAGLQLAVDLGCNFFDTAWAYGDGHSEQLLGKLMAANPGAISAQVLLREVSVHAALPAGGRAVVVAGSEDGTIERIEALAIPQLD